MTIEQYTEEIKPRSTNTEPALFKLHFTAIGDIQEIHLLKQRLEKVSRVELPVKTACETLQKRFDIYAKAINQIDDFFEYHYQRLEKEEIKIAVMTYIDNITKQLSKSV